MKLTRDNLHDFIRGAAILGTGGGGDPYVGRLMLEQELRKGADIRILDPDELQDDIFAINVFSMGAPTVFVEKIPNGPATVISMRKVEQVLGKKFNAVMPVEAGGVNATLPLIVGALTGLPVIDADGMGRAFPELQMVTYNVYGVDICPLVTTDDFGNSVTYETADAARAEWLARGVCVRMGGISQAAGYPMTAQQIKDTAVRHTLTLSVEIGQAVRVARERHQDPVDALLDYFLNARYPRHAAMLFDGKVVDVLRETKHGFTVGRVMLDGIENSDGRCEVTFRNEFLIAKRDGRVVATVPDLICCLDRETAEPITTESLKYGNRVKLVGIAAAPVMRTPEALEIFGPKAFKMEEDFTPLEELG